MPTLMTPRLEVVADGGTVHAVCLGGDRQLNEFARGELFSRCLVSQFQFSHVSFLLPAPRLAGMAPAVTAITDTVHFAQTDLVNWTLVTDGAGVVLIDTGYPGQRDEVLATVRQLGFGIADVRAILLTHAHIDHFGSAIRLAAEHGTPVYCHVNEVGHAKREYLEQASPVDVAMHAWQPRWLKWSLEISRQGAFTRGGIPSTQGLTEEVAAGLPGHPIAIPTPGHTGGHCSYLVDGVLISGDALVTGHPVSTRRGPQLLPSLFNHNEADCVRSLGALAMLETEVLLPGHGDVWRGPVRELAEQAGVRAN
jgi:glyoxylase-like metal-dependent hydrolase (beta-lactamase superfamily II)